MIRVVLGVGCDRGTAIETVKTGVWQALESMGLNESAVTALATIDKKSDEAAFLTLSIQQGWPLRFYSAERLAQVDVPNPSEVVRRYMGTPAVAEAAALLAAGGELLLEKHKYRGNDGRNVTVSIARVKDE